MERPPLALELCLLTRVSELPGGEEEEEEGRTGQGGTVTVERVAWGHFRPRRGVAAAASYSPSYTSKPFMCLLNSEPAIELVQI